MPMLKTDAQKLKILIQSEPYASMSTDKVRMEHLNALTVRKFLPVSVNELKKTLMESGAYWPIQLEQRTNRSAGMLMDILNSHFDTIDIFKSPIQEIFESLVKQRLLAPNIRDDIESKGIQMISPAQEAGMQGSVRIGWFKRLR